MPRERYASDDPREWLNRAESSLAYAKTREMRNVLAHAYFGVDLPTVWKTIREDLPPLKEQLNEVLRQAGGDE